MKKATKKKMTIEDLASTIEGLTVEMRTGFKSVNKKIETEINDLAIMTAKSFEGFGNRMDERFDKIEGRLEKVEDRLKEVEFGQRKNNQDILNLGEKYVTQTEFNNWTMRVMNLENKKSKSK